MAPGRWDRALPQRGETGNRPPRCSPWPAGAAVRGGLAGDSAPRGTVPRCPGQRGRCPPSGSPRLFPGARTLAVTAGGIPEKKPRYVPVTRRGSQKCCPCRRSRCYKPRKSEEMLCLELFYLRLDAKTGSSHPSAALQSGARKRSVFTAKCNLIYLGSEKVKTV